MRFLLAAAIVTMSAASASAQFSDGSKTVPVVKPGNAAPASCSWKPGTSGPQGDPWEAVDRGFKYLCDYFKKDCAGKIELKKLTSDSELAKFAKEVKARDDRVWKEMEAGKSYPWTEWKVGFSTAGADAKYSPFAMMPGIIGPGSKATIVVPFGFFDFACDADQVRWVLAHEMGHIIHGHGAKREAAFDKAFNAWWGKDDGKFKVQWVERMRRNPKNPLQAEFDQWSKEHFLEDPLKSFHIKIIARLVFQTTPEYAQVTSAVKATEAEADKLADIVEIGQSARPLKRMQDLMYAFDMGLGTISDPTHGMPLERLETLEKEHAKPRPKTIHD